MDADTAKTLSARDRSSSSSSPASRPPTRSRTCRAGRRHGRRQDQHRENRRQRRGHDRARQGTTSLKIPLTLAIIPALWSPAAASATRSRRSTWSSSCARGRADRESPRRAGLPAARQPATARVPGTELGVESPADRVRLPVSSCSRPTTAGSAWSSTRSRLEEIMVKPLGSHLKGVDTFAGATIIGDGRVGADPGRARARPARPRNDERAGSRPPSEPRGATDVEAARSRCSCSPTTRAGAWRSRSS